MKLQLLNSLRQPIYVINSVDNTTELVVEIRPETISGLYGFEPMTFAIPTTSSVVFTTARIAYIFVFSTTLYLYDFHIFVVIHIFSAASLFRLFDTILNSRVTDSFEPRTLFIRLGDFIFFFFEKLPFILSIYCLVYLLRIIVLFPCVQNSACSHFTLIHLSIIIILLGMLYQELCIILIT